MIEAYFGTNDGEWFVPTDYARGPWDPDSCHAGPPTALMVRELERLVPDKRLARITVELLRPIPMSGFRTRAEVRRPGRSVTWSSAELVTGDQLLARAHAVHLRVREDDFEVPTVEIPAPRLEESRPGPFPIRETVHHLTAFNSSVDVRYDPTGSQGEGGPTTMWMRTKVPILADEEPSGFQRICPLADSGNGISFNAYLDRVLFVNPDLELTLHRPPTGDWFCSRVVSHWRGDGTGMSDAELFDQDGPVGRAVQNLLLMPPG